MAEQKRAAQLGDGTEPWLCGDNESMKELLLTVVSWKADALIGQKARRRYCFRTAGPAEATKRLAESECLSMVTTHLFDMFDVIRPKFVGRIGHGELLCLSPGASSAAFERIQWEVRVCRRPRIVRRLIREPDCRPPTRLST